ncbi:MAG: hypothetical protein ACR2MM_00585 [Flavobacteriaceae bacterium]
MSQLKPLAKESIPKALTRAKHYRLLNEPKQAESICRDILSIDPKNQLAILIFILAITDQFASEKRTSPQEAKDLCNLLSSEYEQEYYRGIIEERLGKAALKRSSPRVKYIAYEHYRLAMEYYDAAEKISPKDNQDAVLRWNACVRGIDEFKLAPAKDERGRQPFLDV